jgi:hypothetical protein
VSDTQWQVVASRIWNNGNTNGTLYAICVTAS